MRTVGYRRERPITFSASVARLIEGVRFNDEIHKFPTGNTTFIPKGVYHFSRHEDANRHWQNCVAEGMAKERAEMPTRRGPDPGRLRLHEGPPAAFLTGT